MESVLPACRDRPSGASRYSWTGTQIQCAGTHGVRQDMAGMRFTHSNNILSVFRARMSFGARSPQDSAVRRGRRAERLHGRTVPPVTMASVARGNLEPLAEVEGALLVVEVLHLPHPELLSLLRGGEHLHECTTARVRTENQTAAMRHLCARTSPAHSKRRAGTPPASACTARMAPCLE